MRLIMRAPALAVLAAVLAAAPLQSAVFTPGQFSVSETGAAIYTIPIQVPPGTAGMSPKLALVYNSQAGNGLLGMGWSLSGLSAITRCARTLAQDGVRGGINYDANDRFCLDGQRLVVISGGYGENGTEYRTERASFAKIVSYGTAGNGPAWFKVWTKSGQVMEYANTADSRIEAQGKTTVQTWAVNKATDTKGNYFTVTYTADDANGQYYPTRIDYTGNASSNAVLAPYNSVQFVYETRPDIVPLYHAGSLIRNTVRLTRVRSFVGAAMVKDYRLTYDARSANSRSSLSSITECNGSGTCLPPIMLSWTSNDDGLTAPGLWVAAYGAGAAGGLWTDNNVVPRMLADVNGDGKADIVGFAMGGVFVSLSTGSGFTAPTLWVAAYGAGAAAGLWTNNNVVPRMLADVNGDGKADIVGFAMAGVFVSLSTGSGFTAPALWVAAYGAGAAGGLWTNNAAGGLWTNNAAAGLWTNNNVVPRMLADVNGDGKADIVGFAMAGVFVSLSTGSGFTAPALWVAAYGAGAAGGLWTDNNVVPRMLADVNGDGKADIVGFAMAGVFVSLSTGSGFTAPALWVAAYGAGAAGGLWTNNNVVPRMLADVNGDGKADIVGFAMAGVFVSLSTGSGFTAPALWVAAYGAGAAAGLWTDNNVVPRMLADVNADGKADIVGFAMGGVYESLSSGTAFTAPALLVAAYGAAAASGGWSNNNTFPRMLADLDGDGKADIVGFAGAGVHVSLSTPANLPTDAVTLIANGLSATTTINYRPLTDGTVYSPDTTSTYPIQDIQFPLYVVSTVSSSDGIGGSAEAHYAYGGAKLDLQGRGFLGFRWIEATDAAGTNTRTEYNQSFPYTGLPKKLTKTSVTGVLVNQADSAYSFNDLTGANPACPLNAPDASPLPSGSMAGKRYFVYACRSLEQSWDLNGVALPSVTTTSSFDAWGNATQIQVQSSDGYGKTTVNTYSNDALNWILGRLTRAQVTSSAP